MTMNREQITELAHKDPRFQQGIDTAEEMLQQFPIVPEDMDEAIQLLEFALNNPDKYGEIREAAIKDGYVTEDDMPPEFNAVFLVSILVALYGLQDRLKTRGYARGGLAVAGRRLAAQGRGGDSMLAHINPREAEMLKRMGGGGTINPHTGLPEYGWFSSIFKAIIPVALSFIAPGIGTAIGTAISGGLGLGLSAAAAGALGAGVIGAGVGALGGGGLKGALIGGLTSGIGNYAMGPAGLDFGGKGGFGSLFGSETVDPTAPTAEMSGYTPAEGGFSASEMAAQNAANAADYKNLVGAGEINPLTSAAVSQAQGSAAALDMGSLADAPLPASRPTGFDLSDIGGDVRSPSGSIIDNLKSKISNFGLKDAINLAPLALTAGSLLSQPKAVQQAAQSLSPSQQEYFNRPGITWNWDQIQADADRNNMSLGDYMSSNWNNLTAGQYNNPQEETVAAAKGGALNQISNLAKGSGSGRDDTINARLSDGEYVMDAETVALLGDGSNDEGARRLDHMRKQLRAQKGKALAKGKFSPNAKSPLAYFKGAV